MSMSKMRQSHSQDSIQTYDTSTSDSSESVQDLSPDGGWGWVVCFGAFVAFFILDGTMFAFGVLLIELLEYFGDSKGKTAFVGSVLIGASLILGPVVGLLLNRYSCRQVTIAGTLIAVSGFVASIFSPNVEILILTYGFIGGIGFCMVYITSVIAVGIYFSRKRALATGIAISGAGIGIFAYGYLCDFLLSEYDWRGTVLILAGILLNCVLCGAVYRPIYSKTRVHSSDIEQSSKFKGENGYLVNNLISENQGLIADNKSGKLMFPFSSMPGLNMILPENGSLDKHELYYDSLDSKRCLSSSNLFTANDQITSSYLKPMTRKDIFYSGSITNLKIGESQKFSSLLVSLTTKEIDSESCSTASSSSSAELVSRPHWLRHLKHQLKLFKNPRFVILLVSCTLWTAQFISATYVPDMALTKMLSKNHSALLISIIGISNTVARALAGFLTDVLRIPSTYIYITALFLACTVNLLFPWCEHFIQFAVCAALFGLCMGSTVALRTIVLTEHLGIDLLTHAFGIVAMFQGVAFSVVPPLAGMLFDFTGDYIYPFVMVGGMYFVSGVICLPLLLCSGAARLRSEEVIKIEITDDSSVDVSIVSDDENTEKMDKNVTDLIENKDNHLLDSTYVDVNCIPSLQD